MNSANSFNLLRLAMKKIHNVLLIDSDRDDIFLLAVALEGAIERIKYSYSFNGGDALSYLRSTEILPDLIFLDIRLEGMHGLQFLSIIKRDPQYMRIPVIIVTKTINLAEQEEITRLGVKYLILKPSQYEDLEPLITRTLKQLSYF